jgi:histidyl-tRNA synthetase
MTTIANTPPKGTADWFPEELTVRKYIFDTWRKVCTSFGYQEYLSPLLENADIYKAKSGEDVGGTELMTFVDRAGRELAIRPEMTPSVTRMVTQIYDSTPKPIRYFSIANFYRNQKPQRGRNREFWQLNYDLFGSDNVQADIEILQIAIEIMLAFNAPEGAFTLFLNNRKLIDTILNDLAKIDEKQRQDVVRILDKWDKLSKEAVDEVLTEMGLNNEQIEVLRKFMNATSENELLASFPELKEDEGLTQVQQMTSTLKELGYEKLFKFQPNIIRGFDYYDGMVFEVFDNHPANKRSLFGGGRYNGLASIFGKDSFPATGCAPGDETTKLFLESWDLIDGILESAETNNIFLPLLDKSLKAENSKLAFKLRKDGENVVQNFEVMKFGKALSYADKNNFSKVAIIGEQEKEKGIYKIKDMKTGEENIENL